MFDCSLNMKTLIFLFSSFWLFVSFSDTPKFNLNVTISGFQSNEGKAYVALFRKEDKFPKMSGQYLAEIVPIVNKKAIISFSNLPKNEYAIAVFHDKNNNGILDKNMFGIPTEVYGFSNNARETFSAPSFESASVKLYKTTDISIYVK